ncbi:hypothetical protein [Pseudomonas fragi]|uniref:hypothetical protein n=1 Tax=Pseudomonas fragi TaxID=296 RepID=UPI002D785181|nr:hypothetical protein [Pseudomonas fragi]WRT61572.1 hypothetical protein VK847_04260 [Pseudomonas fragi]
MTSLTPFQRLASRAQRHTPVRALMHWLRQDKQPLPRRQERLLALVMLTLTLLYLMVEMGFNARLLDVVGGLASHHQVESIEFYGRLIAGTAVALLGLGMVLKKSLRLGWSRLRTTIWAALVIVGCIGTTYFAQLALVNHLVGRSTPDERARAALGVPMTYLMMHHDFKLTGLNLTPEDLQRPEGKTLLATFPIMLLSADHLTESIKQQAQPFFELFAETVRGDADVSYRHYQDSLAELNESYRQYQQGSSRYLEAISAASIARHQQQAWSDYVQNLKQRNRRLTPNNVPRRHAHTVRQSLREKGINVADDWRPNDRAGFNQAVARRVQLQARSTYAAGLVSVDRWIDPGLARAQFFAQLPIQNKWRDALHLPYLITLQPDLSPGGFEQTVYRPTISYDAKQLIEDRLVDPQNYRDRGEKAQIGRDSYRALIVPMIALLFSLLGAFTHIFKCLGFFTRTLCYVPPRLYMLAFAGYALVVLTVPMYWTNKVTEQPLFLDLKQQNGSALGPMGWIIAHSVQWTAQVQPVFYPLNERVRQQLLGGLTYGYQPQ